MAYEIQKMFDDAVDDDKDELAMYTEMLEWGIDLDMVYKYLGCDACDHMLTFCDKYGLI